MIHRLNAITAQQMAAAPGSRVPSVKASMKALSTLGTLVPRTLEDAAPNEAVTAHLLLVLGVISLPSRMTRRKLMRETSFANASRAVSLHFVLGKEPSDRRLQAAIETEQAAHGDMLVLDAEERGPGFKAMDCAHKTHLFFQWCVVKFADVPYCGKTEDDAFVHLPRLLRRRVRAIARV